MPIKKACGKCQRAIPRDATCTCTPERKKWSTNRRVDKAKYNSAAWKRTRKFVLSRDPFCVRCLARGHHEPSVHVDHKIAVADGGTDHADNLQGLCKPCHSSKTATEINARRWGKKKERRQ